MGMGMGMGMGSIGPGIRNCTRRSGPSRHGVSRGNRASCCLFARRHALHRDRTGVRRRSVSGRNSAPSTTTAARRTTRASRPTTALARISRNTRLRHNPAGSGAAATSSNRATRAGRQPGHSSRRRIRHSNPRHELISHQLPTRPHIPSRLRTRRMLHQRRIHRHPPRHRHQRRHIRHQIRRRPTTHPPIPHRLPRSRHILPRVQPLPDPRRGLRRLPVTEPTQLPGQLRIHQPPVLQRQTRRLPHDQRRPPLTDHPGPQRRQHVRHLRREHLRQPHMPTTPHRRLLTRQRHLPRHTPPRPLIPRPHRRQPRRLRLHKRHRQLRLRRRTRRLHPLQLPDPTQSAPHPRPAHQSDQAAPPTPPNHPNTTHHPATHSPTTRSCVRFYLEHGRRRKLFFRTSV